MIEAVLTVAEALEALARIGPPPVENGEHAGTHLAHCPVCEIDPYEQGQAGARHLLISQNGKGASLTCTNGCAPQLIAAHLRRAAAQPRTNGTDTDPLAQLREQLRLPTLARVIKRGDAGAVYDLELTDGRRPTLGTSADLLTRTRFRHRMTDLTGHIPPLLKQADHDDLIQQLINIAEQDDQAVTDDEEARSWIASYARNALSTPTSGPDLYDTLRDSEARDIAAPALRTPDGHLHLSITGLRNHIERYHGQSITQRDLSIRLLRLGFTRTKLSGRRGQDVKSTRRFTSPTDWSPE
ncbi:MAG: hypothetical protein U0R70_08850 [Solirubrobacteraceae bacterium]